MWDYDELGMSGLKLHKNCGQTDRQVDRGLLFVCMLCDSPEVMFELLNNGYVESRGGILLV